jgi:MoxR-like ATPase
MPAFTQTDQATALQALVIAVTARVPVLLWGGPGTGKTSAVRDLASAMNWPCEVVIASIREPSDFGGLPVVAEGRVRFAPPDWAGRLVDAGKGILFLDEISTAAPAVQAALLRVVLERRVGDLAIPDDVAVVAAANPPEQTADGWDLSAPLANRFCHLDWQPDAAAFSEGITAGWRKPLVQESRVIRKARFEAARALVAAFAIVRPNLLLLVPRDVSAAGRAWPSPRTWEMAARLYAVSEDFDAPGAVRTALIAGSVGPGAAIEFLTWVGEMDLQDPEEALSDPDTFELPTRGDRAYAALSAIAAAIAANPTPERWVTGWKLLGRAGAQSPDIAAQAARILARCRPGGTPLPEEIKIFLPLLESAGLA